MLMLHLLSATGANAAELDEVNPWPLIATVCSSKEAVAPRATLHRSNQLKELLWASLEEIMAECDKHGEGSDVRAQRALALCVSLRRNLHKCVLDAPL
jgi:hypothetical protein